MAKYFEVVSSLVGQKSFRDINFDDATDKKLHDDIALLQQQLISVGDRIQAAGNNQRVLAPLNRNFNLKKREMETLIQQLFGLTEQEYLQIPQISEMYATV